MCSQPVPELPQRSGMKRLLFVGWMIMQVPVIFLLIRYFGNESQLISADPTTIFLEGIEVDQTAITEVALQNNSEDVFCFCGDTGRCLEKYCLFAKGPSLGDQLESGATMKIQIKFTPGVAGPFSEEIAVYFRRKASTETITFRVSGLAISSSK